MDGRSCLEALSRFRGEASGLPEASHNQSIPPVHPCGHELTQLLGNDTADGKSIIAIVQGDVSIIVRIGP